MTEQHPSISAVGSHFDEKVEVAALAQRYYEEAGSPAGRSMEFWLRAEKELHAPPAPAPSEARSSKEDKPVEEAMHLDQ